MTAAKCSRAERPVLQETLGTFPGSPAHRSGLLFDVDSGKGKQSSIRLQHAGFIFSSAFDVPASSSKAKSETICPQNRKEVLSVRQKNIAIGICLLLGYAATKCTDLQTAIAGRVVIGGPMLALLVSMILCNLLPDVNKDFKEGTTYASKRF